MKNIFITQGIYLDKHNSTYLKTDYNWVKYSKKMKFNLFQICDIKNLVENKNKIDGIIFSGGNDFSKIKLTKVNLLRDKFEKKILRFAKKKNIPSIFVCRGMQFLANDNKITLTHDKTHANSFETIKLITNEKINTNSFHNYKLMKSNKNFENLGRSLKDNSIEIMHHVKYKFLCMMFHPERHSKDQKKIDKIFKNFFNL